MAYKVRFKASVKKDLRKIDKKEVSRIINAIERELVTEPKKGKQLGGEFSGLYRYRIGEYRIIYSIFKDCILILRVGHRKDVYK